MTIIVPMALLASFTLLVTLALGISRVKAVSQGLIATGDLAFIGCHTQQPQRCLKLLNNYNNLLQLPLLFYVLGALLLWLGQGEQLAWIIAAWCYVLLRLIHSVIHIGVNVVRLRLAAFASSSLLLLGMWLVLLWQQLLV